MVKGLTERNLLVMASCVLLVLTGVVCLRTRVKQHLSADSEEGSLFPVFLAG